MALVKRVKLCGEKVATAFIGPGASQTHRTLVCGRVEGHAPRYPMHYDREGVWMWCERPDGTVYFDVVPEYGYDVFG